MIDGALKTFEKSDLYLDKEDRTLNHMIEYRSNIQYAIIFMSHFSIVNSAIRKIWKYYTLNIINQENRLV